MEFFSFVISVGYIFTEGIAFIDYNAAHMLSNVVHGQCMTKYVISACHFKQLQKDAYGMKI